MSQHLTRKTAGILAAGAVVVLSVAGCSSDDGSQYRAQLSSVQAQQSATAATVAAARGYTQDLGPIYAYPPGPERLKWVDKAMAMTCPGSAAAAEFAKGKTGDWLDKVQYVPGSRTEVVGAFADKSPGTVIVVARTVTANQTAKVYSTASRVTIGDNHGKACISKIEYL